MSKNRIIGRDYEQHILQNICGEDEARLVAVYGRRRVGKTYLVKYRKIEQRQWRMIGESSSNCFGKVFGAC